MSQDGLSVAGFALAAPAKEALALDQRRIVIVGARGWIGRAATELLRAALGPEAFAQRVVLAGSSAARIRLDDGTVATQLPLAALRQLDHRPTLLLHLAFMTKDKIAGMDEADYVRVNTELSHAVRDLLPALGVDRLFVASSGAAAFADDPDAAADLRLYGRLKRDDEELFAAWAREAAAGRRALIGRIYAISGRYMNKLGTYALASFILDGLAGKPIEVRAPMQVFRSYVAVRELLSVVFCGLLARDGAAAQHFETGGERMELGEVAATVAAAFAGEVQRRPVTEPRANVYCGDAAGWDALLRRFGIAHVPLSEQVAETAAYLQSVTDTGAGH